MKRPQRWDFRLIGGFILTGLVVAAISGGFDVAVALADGHGHGREGRQREGRPERGHDRGRHYGRYRRGYAAPVYVEPPVIYSPPAYYSPPVYYAPPAPAPGISIFLPFR